MRAARGRFLPSSESPTPSTPLPSRPARPVAEAATGRRSLCSQPCPRPGSPPVERGKITEADAVVPASSARRNCALAGAILGSSSGLIVIRQLRPDGGQSWPPRAVSLAKRLAPPCGGELPVWSGPCRVPPRGRRRILAATGRAAEGVGEQAGDAHLGDAELLADLPLRHVTVKAYPQDLLLTKGQLAPVRGDGPAYRACRSLERGRDRRMPSSSWSSSPARFLKHPRRGR